MKWLTRPSILLAALAAVVIGAAVAIFWPQTGQLRPTPLPVAEGDHEIVWLYTATNAASWERFVAAVRRSAGRLQQDQPGLQPDINDANAFPRQTTAVPEVSLALPGKAGRLVFRWYKITSDWKTRDWVEALLKRPQPPLAIIGGSSSDAARELAGQLRDHTAGRPEKDRPLLLLTTATADRVSDPDAPAQDVDLTRLYADRTFRYCFSNRQMASAVMRFLLSRDDMRPDANPVHMVQWDDDSYSHDLTDGFREALPPSSGLINPARIASSVGSFLTPNRFEAEAVDDLLSDLERAPEPQSRPLLVVTGQSAPSRRFLRELARTAPAQARRFVVVTGDALAFNTVYRDRRVAWPIQDLPFALVFFTHFNPIDPDAGFRPEDESSGGDEGGTSSTGTEDILLNGAIVETLVEAFVRDGKPAADAADLAARLAEIRHRHGLFGYDPEGTALFGAEGNRLGGAGENLVYLRPHFRGDDRPRPASGGFQGSSSFVRPAPEGERVLPEATIEVWFSRESVVGAERPWDRRGEPLKVSYAPPVVEVRSGP
jgi:hypothetical protein